MISELESSVREFCAALSNVNSARVKMEKTDCSFIKILCIYFNIDNSWRHVTLLAVPLPTETDTHAIMLYVNARITWHLNWVKKLELSVP